MTTAAERLLQLAGKTGSAASLLLAIGVGATTGAALVQYSQLPTATAAEHLLADVQHGWDTEQGIARNLANNLKWEPIAHGEATFFVPPAQTGGQLVWAGSANGYGVFLPCSGYTGSAYDVVGAANAFVAWASCGATVGVNLQAEGNAFAEPIFSGGGVSGASDLLATAEGVAEFNSCCSETGVSTLTGYGVRNPTDEEMTLLIANLLTSKQKHDPISQLHRRVI